MKIQSENIAFSSHQMIGCPKCGKPNPPNRASCLYCSAALEMREGARAGVKLNLRKLENWENGFNLILMSRAANADSAAAARYLKHDAEVFDRMIEASDPFPLLRIESAAEAEIAVKRLASLGVTAKIVSDIDLKIGKPNTRLRSVEFVDDGVRFTSFNTSEQLVVGGAEFLLIVVGKLIESKTESVEKGKKEKRKVLAETASSSDDILLDVYTAHSEPGWRVTTKGFDFSPLGKDKSLLAVENIQRLLEKLIALAPGAKVVDEYARLINPLSEVWDIERRTDFEGLKRTGVWKSGFSSVARSTNLEQFTKYSRLQRLLL